MISPALTPPTPILAYGNGSTAASPFRSKASEAVRLWGYWISGIGIAFFDFAVVILAAVTLGRYLNYEPLTFLGLRMWGWGPAPEIAEVVGDCIKQIWPLIPLAALFFAYGFVLRILAKPVDRDSKGACWAALWLISPWTLVFAFLGFGFSVLAIGFGTGLFHASASPEYLLLLLFAALAIWLLVISVKTSYRLFLLARTPGVEIIPLDSYSPAAVEFSTPETATPGPALPKVRALNYMGRIDTPTAVRRITGRGVLLVGLLCGLLSLCVLVYFAKGFLTYLVPWGGPLLDLRAMRDAFSMTFSDDPAVFLSGILLFPGVIIAFVSPLIRRGNTPACVLTFLYAIFLLVVMFLVVPVLLGMVIIYMDLFRPNPHPEYALWFLFFPLAVLAILLLKDIAACLFWIMRHPTLEKAPVRFIGNRP